MGKAHLGGTEKVKEKEPLRLVLELTRSYDFGVWQPLLNGVRLGEPIDHAVAEPGAQEGPG